MLSKKSYALAAGFALALLPNPPAHAQATPAPGPQTMTHHETIQVTATRVPEDVLSTPASVTVISGEDLVARGVTDLASALSLVAGVNVAPGGDGGPAGSVPEIWGLREFDAFLLVVDGVPWGGAFNPALPSLDLTNVERIEVLRGSAPVMYGATSFVGVIHVIHHAAGDATGSATVGVRNHGGGIAAVVVPLGGGGGGATRQSLTVNGERMGYDDDRAGYDRGHLLYRATADTVAGALRFDADVAVTRQDPSSPHPREGGSLSSRVPLDANHQPKDAHVDEDRFHLVAGLDRQLGGNPWTSTLAVTHTSRAARAWPATGGPACSAAPGPGPASAARRQAGRSEPPPSSRAGPWARCRRSRGRSPARLRRNAVAAPARHAAAPPHARAARSRPRRPARCARGRSLRASLRHWRSPRRPSAGRWRVRRRCAARRRSATGRRGRACRWRVASIRVGRSAGFMRSVSWWAKQTLLFATDMPRTGAWPQPSCDRRTCHRGGTREFPGGCRRSAENPVDRGLPVATLDQMRNWQRHLRLNASSFSACHRSPTGFRSPRLPARPAP